MFQSKRFFLCAGLKRYFIQNWTNNTSCLYPPGLFLHNLQNSDLRFYSNTRGVTDTMAHADELNFINVLFVDIHTHLIFGSICLRISQAMLSNRRYGDNRLSTKTGKSSDYGVWTWSGNALHLLNGGDIISLHRVTRVIFFGPVLVYMVISSFFSKVEGIWVISKPFETAAPHLLSEDYCCIDSWILTNMVSSFLHKPKHTVSISKKEHKSSDY